MMRNLTKATIARPAVITDTQIYMNERFGVFVFTNRYTPWSAYVIYTFLSAPRCLLLFVTIFVTFLLCILLLLFINYINTFAFHWPVVFFLRFHMCLLTLRSADRFTVMRTNFTPLQWKHYVCFRWVMPSVRTFDSAAYNLSANEPQRHDFDFAVNVGYT